MSGALAFAAGVCAVLAAGDLLPRRRPGRLAGGGGRRAAAGPRAVRALAAIGRPALAAARAPHDLAALLYAAGRPGGLTAREVLAAKLAAAVAAGGVGVAAGPVLPGRLWLVATVGAPVAGFLAPDLWLRRRARDRLRALRVALPGQLDLLAVSLGAGLGLPGALAAVGARTRGPLAAEWRTVAREVELGEPLERALGRMQRRMPAPEVEALAAALARASRHGVPIGETLVAQARAAQLARARRIEEAAARAGPKIQLVVALLLVPSVLLLVAAALVAALIEGGGTALI